MAVSDWPGASLPWFEVLAGLKERIGGLFRRAEPRRRLDFISTGSSAAANVRTAGKLTEHAGDPAPWRMQALLGRMFWDDEQAREIGRGYVIAHLGDPSGVLVLPAS